ncbi:MAG: hypothetical protein ABH879_08145 [archaeon]
MTDINFCPYCDSPSHKILVFTDFNFCKECNRFFSLKQLALKCPKCGNTKIMDSDFPTPDGEMVFQCNSCKKMFSSTEFFENNK